MLQSKAVDMAESLRTCYFENNKSSWKMRPQCEPNSTTATSGPNTRAEGERHIYVFSRSLSVKAQHFPLILYKQILMYVNVWEE